MMDWIEAILAISLVIIFIGLLDKLFVKDKGGE